MEGATNGTVEGATNGTVEVAINGTVEVAINDTLILVDKWVNDTNGTAGGGGDDGNIIESIVVDGKGETIDIPTFTCVHPD